MCGGRKEKWVRGGGELTAHCDIYTLIGKCLRWFMVAVAARRRADEVGGWHHILLVY